MLAEDKKITEQITWYFRHKAEVLTYQNNFVAELPGTSAQNGMEN